MRPAKLVSSSLILPAAAGLLLAFSGCGESRGPDAVPVTTAPAPSPEEMAAAAGPENLELVNAPMEAAAAEERAARAAEAADAAAQGQGR